MSFLQPWLLLGLPAIALPVVIHLLNQRRHQTVPWAASAFVKQISRVNRGHAVIRQWLILLLRTLAVAAVIFAMSRPLATSVSGLSLLGAGRPQLILVDRSPSMAFRDSSTGLTRRETLLGQLDTLMKQTGSQGRRRLIEPLRQQTAEAGNHDLVSLSDTDVAASSTDIPSLVEASLDSIETDTLGPTDVWVCSDLQAADWNLTSGRWNRIRQRLANLPGTKLRILSPAAAVGFNLAVSVSNVTKQQKKKRHYLEMDIAIQQTHGEVNACTIPITIHVAGTERRLDAELIAGRFDAKRVRVELPDNEAQGGGMIQLPADANDEDNTWFFAYAPPTPRRTVVVSGDDDVRTLLELVCTTAQTEGVSYECDQLPISRSNEVNWSEASLVVWHAGLPSGDVATRLRQFVESGRTVLFLPPESTDHTDGTSLFDVSWQQWDKKQQSTDGNQVGPSGYQVESWRRDDDVLATESDGRVLPVDELVCQRRCLMESANATTLAAFSDGIPMLVRAATQNGGAYFLATLPTASTANFVDNGIVLYVLLHRCLEAGAAAGSVAQQVDAGQLADANTRDWKPLDAISASVPPSERPFRAGLYSTAGQLLAINRTLKEDNPEALDRVAIAEILGENSFDLVSAGATNLSSLASEMWKPFAILVIVALFVEGWMSLPPKKTKTAGSSVASVPGAGVTATAGYSSQSVTGQSAATALQETS